MSHPTVKSGVLKLTERLRKNGSVLAVVIILIGWYQGCNHWIKQRKEERARDRIVVSNSTTPVPSLFSLAELTEPNPFPWCPGVDTESNTVLPDTPDHHIEIQMQPCWGGFVSIPPSWDGVTFQWEQGNKMAVWPSGNKLKILHSGKENNVRYVGRTFRVAGTGPLHLRPEKVDGKWLRKLVGTTASNGDGSISSPVSEAELAIAEGTLVQWYPKGEFIVLKTSTGEEKFSANKNTQVTVGHQVYYLGNQWLLSSRQSYYPEPGDKYQVRYYESTKLAVQMVQTSNVRDHLPEQEETRAASAEISPLVSKETVVRGRITRIDEVSGEIFLENSKEMLVVTTSGKTEFFVDGERCEMSSLRVGDIIRAYFLPGETDSHRIELGTPMDPSPQLTTRNGDPFTNEYWANKISTN